jgi:Bardet-Biedl syndrome 2 protein
VPKFACLKTTFEQINPSLYPKSNVSFEIKTTMDTLRKWLCNSFLIIIPENISTSKMSVTFESFKTNSRSVLEVLPDKGLFTLYTDQLEFAVEVVSDITAFIGITELESIANFPNEIANVKALISKIDEFQKFKHTVSASIAEFVSQVKELAVRAEDTRMIGDMKALKKIYNSLNANNGFILAEYNKRLENHNEMTKHISELGQIIKSFSGLRSNIVNQLGRHKH